MRSLAGVSAAACVTFDDEGELGIVAFVVAETEVSVSELRQAARERLPETMLPNRIELVEELPMTKSSKLDERLLLAEAGLQPAGVRDPPSPRPDGALQPLGGNSNAVTPCGVVRLEPPRGATERVRNFLDVGSVEKAVLGSRTFSMDLVMRT